MFARASEASSVRHLKEWYINGAAKASRRQSRAVQYRVAASMILQKFRHKAAKCRRQATDGQGFWLSEVLISIWLLTFVGAALIATFSFIAKGSQTSADRAAAELLVEKLLDEAFRSGPPGWGQSELSGQVSVKLGDAESSTHFDWSLSPVEVQEAEFGKLFQIRVAVTWMAQEAEQALDQQGQGRLSRARLVYIEDI